MTTTPEIRWREFPGGPGTAGRSQVLLVVLGTFIVVVVLFVALVYPKMHEVRAARLRATRLQQEVTRTAAMVQSQPQVQQRLLAARAAMQNLLVRVPVGPQLPGLIAQLDGAIVISGVQLVQISFASAEQVANGPAAPSAGIGTIGLAIQVRGSYPQVRRFVAVIETAPRAMAVDRLALTASEGGTHADLAVRAFYRR